jgi:hypothetical protein
VDDDDFKLCVSFDRGLTSYFRFLGIVLLIRAMFDRMLSLEGMTLLKLELGVCWSGTKYKVKLLKIKTTYRRWMGTT